MKRIFLSVLFIFCLFGCFAQKLQEQIRSLVVDGEFFLNDRQYEKSYSCFSKVLTIDPDKGNHLFYKLKRGIAATHIPSKKVEAIASLEEIKNADSTFNAIFFFLGEAYHNNYDFDKAIFYLEKFIKNDPKAKENKDAEMFLAQARNGKNVTQTKVNSDIVNIGSPVNTAAAEYVPVVSADESVMIYTYKGPRSTGGLMDMDFNKDVANGEYYEDIFITRKKDENWDEPKGISSKINTKHNDAAIALSPDGQELYTFYSTNKDGGDIYVCRLEGDQWSTPEKLGPNINTKYWEGSCSISGDGKHLYFASERPGGLGGKDIYVSEMGEDSKWGKAENLGPLINTKYDDDSPFIHPDGITLFFSSQGHNSIGGFDIMYSIKKDNDWIEPTNMGYPLNTTDDDIYYVITAKGDKGYFSSTRTGKGEKGSHDIYLVTPGVSGDRPVLAMVKGVVYGNDVPMIAEFKIIKKSDGEVIGPFHSNKTTGKYLVALSPGESYEIEVNAATYPPYKEDFDIEKLTKFAELNKDFYLAKNGFTNKHIEERTKKLNEMLALYTMLDTITDVSYLNNIKLDSFPVIGDSAKNSIAKTDSIKKINSGVDTVKIVMTKQDSIREARNDSVRAVLAKRDSIKNAKNDTTKIVVVKNDSIKNTNPEKDDLKNITAKKDSIKKARQDSIKELIAKKDSIKIARRDSLKNVLALNQKIKQQKTDSIKNTNPEKEDVKNILAKKDSIKKAKNDSIKELIAKKDSIKIARRDSLKNVLALNQKIKQQKKDSIKNSLFVKNDPDNNPNKNTSVTLVEPCDGFKALDFSELKRKSLNDPEVYRKLLEIGTKICAKGMVFKVQIAAYRYPQNYVWVHLKEFGQPEMLNVNGITRITQGQFTSILDAENQRKASIAKGQTDAWVTAVIDGKRYTLEELIMVDFYNKNISNYEILRKELDEFMAGR